MLQVVYPRNTTTQSTILDKAQGGILMDAKDLIARLKELGGFRTDIQVADMLGITQSDLSNRKKRNTLANLYPAIIKWAKKSQIPLDDIFQPLDVQPNSFFTTFSQTMARTRRKIPPEEFQEIYQLMVQTWQLLTVKSPIRRRRVFYLIQGIIDSYIKAKDAIGYEPTKPITKKPFKTRNRI